MSHRICTLLMIAAITLQANAQSGTHSEPEESSLQKPGFIGKVFNLWNMAGGEKANQFRPLTQAERNHLFYKTMVNPLSFVRCAASAGLDQWKDKPEEWQQGASGYGKRFGNILGQYSIQRTTTYALESVLHEDNRYFNSGKSGFWSRTAYALSSGILARHDDGTRHFSFSQVGGVATGAFVARAWLPASQQSAAEGAKSFGITMASNIGFGAVKEFLPDLVRPFVKKHKKSANKPGIP